MRRTSWSLAIALTACGGGGGGKKPDAGNSHQTVVSVSATPNRDLDLLFVIDDSASMADKQNNLAVNFPNFINVLAQIEGGLPNLHLGVVTTDMGTKGTGNATPGAPIGVIGQGGCAQSGDDGKLQVNGASVNGTFVTDVAQSDGTRQRNYTGTLADVFAQMARVGANGCGFEQPLHAMKRALETGNNPGFLRPDALLAVVFLADEDDCTAKDPKLFEASTAELGALTSFRCTRFGVTCTQGGQTPDQMNTVGAKDGCSANEASAYLDGIAPYRDFLLGLKTDPNQIVVGGIIGNPTPVAVETRQINGQNITALAHSCTYQGANGEEVADPGVRFKALFDHFPGRSSHTSICQPDLSVSLEDLAHVISRRFGSTCINVPLADVDPLMPGLQVDCVAEDVVGATATPIAKCSSPDVPPCWRLEVDALKCPAADNLRLVVVRDGAPDPQTVTNLRCRVP